MIRADYYDLATCRKVRRRFRRTVQKVKIKGTRVTVILHDAKGGNILKTRRYKARILLTKNLKK